MSDEKDTASDSGQDSELVRKLREEIKQRDAALAEERSTRSTLERQQAFRDAGVDPTQGPGKLLFDNYQGEATAEAVQAKLEEYGLADTPSKQQDTGGDEQPQQTGASEQERAAMRQMDQAATGGSPDRLPTDPVQAAHEAFDREMATSGSREEAMAKSFNARMVAALEAQKRGRR